MRDEPARVSWVCSLPLLSKSTVHFVFSFFTILSVSNHILQTNEAVRPAWPLFNQSLPSADVQGLYLWIKMETM